MLGVYNKKPRLGRGFCLSGASHPDTKRRDLSRLSPLGGKDSFVCFKNKWPAKGEPFVFVAPPRIELGTHGFSVQFRGYFLFNKNQCVILFKKLRLHKKHLLTLLIITTITFLGTNIVPLFINIAVKLYYNIYRKYILISVT